MSRQPSLGVAARALLLGLLTAIALIAPATAGDFIHTDGKRLAHADGSDFEIKGISLGNWLMPEGYMFKFHRARSPREIAAVFEHLTGKPDAERFWQAYRENYIGADDIRFIKAAGFTTVRVPLHYGLFVDGQDRFAGPGYALLDRLIDWCRQADLRVILDLHAAPGGQTGVNHDDGTGYPLVFYVPRYRRMTVDLWRQLAGRYAGEATVLGFDLLNEPISPYHDEGYLNPQLEPLYEEIASAIRAVDPKHILFLAAAQWSTNFGVFGRPSIANVVYTYHKFWASTERDSIQEYLDFSDRWNVPLFLGEAGELNDAWNDAFRRLHERFGIGWCFWTYKNLDSKSTVVSIRRPDGWDSIAALGDAAPSDWQGAEQPASEQAVATVAAYLNAMKFANASVNRSYLASLGLGAP